jgi:hypothetical protein
VSDPLPPREPPKAPGIPEAWKRPPDRDWPTHQEPAPRPTAGSIIGTVILWVLAVIVGIPLLLFGACVLIVAIGQAGR